MTLLLQTDFMDREGYAQGLRNRLPEMPVRVFPDTGPVEAIRYAVVWKPPRGLLPGLPKLRAVINLGAGVDGILADPDLPADVPVYRLEDAGMASQMAGWVVHGVLRCHRRFDDYASAQAGRRWRSLEVAPAERVLVGLMGLGVLGRACADALRPLGYRLRGWSRSPRTVEGVQVFAGPDRLAAFLAGLDVLVCLLPLTDETRGLINQDTLARLAPAAAVLNAARGQHIVDADLLAALESGHISRAVLDVCDPEPLPQDHPFWTHPRVILTPHIAAETLVEPACDQVAQTIDRLERGDPPPSVNRQAGY